MAETKNEAQKASEKTGAAKPPEQQATMSKKEIELQKKVLDLQSKVEQLQDVQKEAESIEKDVKTESSADMEVLKAQVQMLSNQVMLQQSHIDPSRAKYKPVPPDDYQDEAVTISARQVYLIIGSYINEKGMEVLPPYKLFKLQYAASDITQDGSEESIVNFCTYTTHLKAEIKFLRDHPGYGVVFFEDIKEAVSSDHLYSEFRTRASHQVRSMSDEAVLQEATRLKVPKLAEHSVRSLRGQLIILLGNEYIRSAKEMEDQRAKDRLMASHATQPTE